LNSPEEAPTSGAPLGSPAKGRTAVIVPTVNEAQTIAGLIGELLDLGERVHIYVVDDGSSDGTVQKVERLARSSGSVTLFARTERKGLGDALRFGMRQALSDPESDPLVTMDGDLSHSPLELPGILRTGADLTVGSRYVGGGEIEGWSSFRRAMSLSANWLARLCLGIKTRDATSGFRAYSRRASELVVSRSTSDGFQFQVEAVWLAERTGLIVREAPIRFRERKLGWSKLATAREVMSMLAFLISHIPQRVPHR